MTPKKYGTHHKRPQVSVYLSRDEKDEITRAMRLTGDGKISTFLRRAALALARIKNQAGPVDMDAYAEPVEESVE